jgi:OTU domain-containing protein 3
VCAWIERHRTRYAPFCEDERGLDTHLDCMRQQGKSPIEFLSFLPRSSVLLLLFDSHGVWARAGTYGGHMELSAFAHLTGRDVKVVQPGLVYVIEAAPDVVVPPTAPAPQDVDEDADADADDDQPRSRRARRRAGKDRDKDKDKASTHVSDGSDDDDDGPGPIYVA